MKQADISRLIAATWKIEPDEVKLDYEKRAAIAKAEHKKKYPDYKYNPLSKEVKDKMRADAPDVAASYLTPATSLSDEYDLGMSLLTIVFQIFAYVVF